MATTMDIDEHATLLDTAGFRFQGIEIPSKINTEADLIAWADRDGRMVELDDGELIRFKDIPSWTSVFPDAHKMGLADIGLATVPIWASKRGKMWSFSEKEPFHVVTRCRILTNGYFTHDECECIVFDQKLWNNVEMDELKDVANSVKIAMKKALRVVTYIGRTDIGGTKYEDSHGGWGSRKTISKCRPTEFRLNSTSKGEPVNLPNEVRKALGIPDRVLTPSEAFNSSAPLQSYRYCANNKGFSNAVLNQLDIDASIIDDAIATCMHHKNTYVDVFGKMLAAVRQGGFKYTERKKQTASCYLSTRSGFRVLGNPALEGVSRLQVGRGEFLPTNGAFPPIEACNETTIAPLLDKGFENYATIPSGRVYIMTRVLPDGQNEVFRWMGAPFGAFVYTGTKPPFKKRFGAIVFAFGVDATDQTEAMNAMAQTADVTTMPAQMCLACYSAPPTHAYNLELCRKHPVWCEDCVCNCPNVKAWQSCPVCRANVQDVDIVQPGSSYRRRRRAAPPGTDAGRPALKKRNKKK
ncbi:uncharacterized protein [Amphiura filiformis]|uniref:uncharacterized protein n=1 Tax=Amphiura filiformis TaxID=82378 RepID=UPI003B21B246